MVELWAVSTPATNALRISAFPFALDNASDDPPDGAIGSTVALCSLSMIVGVAKLAGIVYTTKTDPAREHPHAERIRCSYDIANRYRGPVLLVWENGLPFGEPLPVKSNAEVGKFFTLPESFRPRLRAAFKAAKERRGA